MAAARLAPMTKSYSRSRSVIGSVEMAEITNRRSGELVRSVFEILSHEPEGLPVKEILHQLKQRLPPTEFEKSHYLNVRARGVMRRSCVLQPLHR